MPESRDAEIQRETLSLVTARVRDAYLRKPFYVDGGQDVVSVCRAMAQQHATCALVRDGERLGMFTTTDLRDALLRDVPPERLAVREVARFDLVGVRVDDELFEALWLMVRHRVHRLVVRDGDAVVGVLGQLDLVSFVAHQSHIVALQIDESGSVAALQEAAQRIDAMVQLLQDGGIKIERIARLVGALNHRLFARLWQLVAPAELIANSCLLVMGSEGRGEQILKTDQDNALLLRDGFAADDLAAIAERFNAALADFGYPPCPGGIMLTNALWRQPLAAFKETLAGWIYGADPDGVINLAIFVDAVAVAGDASLLDEARRHMGAIMADNAGFLARFAKAADQFAEPEPWWSRFAPRRTQQAIDLKRVGTFPIVHGARALALQHRVDARGTAQRLQILAERGQLRADVARDLVDTLHLLMRLRLEQQLAARRSGQPVDNRIVPAALGALERDMLTEALAIVGRFRQHLRQHFRLDLL